MECPATSCSSTTALYEPAAPPEPTSVPVAGNHPPEHRISEVLRNESFALNFDQPLINRRHLAQTQLLQQTFLVNAFNQSRAFQAMNLNGRPNHRFGLYIRLYE